MTYEEQNKLIQKLMRDFDSLFKKIGFELSGTRFLEVDGKRLSQMEYCQYKLKQLTK